MGAFALSTLSIALALSNPPKVTLTWSGQATQIMRAQGNCWNASKLSWTAIAQIPPSSTYTDLTTVANEMYCYYVMDARGNKSNYIGEEVVVVN